MLFRIEDNKNVDGRHREYEIPFDCLPVLKPQELEKYIAEEVRKEINDSQDRKLLSYSKLLGVCLLKYNEYADNELHINMDYLEGVYGGVYFYYKKEDENLKTGYVPFDLMNGLFGLKKQKYGKKIKLLNFNIDVSDNNLLDEYLKKMTGTGRKKVASPEKDKEILLMQALIDILDNKEKAKKMSECGQKYMEHKSLEYGFEQFYQAVEKILSNKELMHDPIEKMYNKEPIMADSVVNMLPKEDYSEKNYILQDDSFIGKLKRNRFIRNNKLVRKIYFKLRGF